MTDSLISTLTSLILKPAHSAGLGLPSGSLQLRRAWPRAADHLGLEYLAVDGQIIPGQWFSDLDRLKHVAQRTTQSNPEAAVTTVTVAGTKIVLQSRGADRRLPGLAPLLAQSGAQLLVHRPERRAVVRLQTSSGLRFAKIVRSDRLSALIATGNAAHELTGKAFVTPKLLEIDEDKGVAIWSALPGSSLYDLVNSDSFDQAARKAGVALRALHEASPPVDVGLHDAAAEVGVLQRWFDRLAAFTPAWTYTLRAAADNVFAALVSESSPHVLLHRDFYDKQIFIDAQGQVGLLDFDTLTTGEAALDLANALVHFELRALLGRCSPKKAAAACQAMLAGYQPSGAVCRRLKAYADATRLRLACVYTFRPHGLPILTDLLAKIGQPIPS